MADECETNGCPHADKSAELAVRKTFAILGVDVDNPKEVEEFRMDLRFGKSMRRASDRGAWAVLGAFFSVMVAGTLAVVWAGIVSKLGGH